MSFVTTAPAPMTTLSQIATGRSVALLPILKWLPMRVDRQRLLSPRRRSATCEHIVDENNSVPDEAVVTDLDQFTNKRMRFYFTSISNFNRFLNFNKRPNAAVVTN